jgi:hypothetical protein
VALKGVAIKMGNISLNESDSPDSPNHFSCQRVKIRIAATRPCITPLMIKVTNELSGECVPFLRKYVIPAPLPMLRIGIEKELISKMKLNSPLSSGPKYRAIIILVIKPIG